MADGTILKNELKAAHDAIEQVEETIMAFRVARQLDQLTPAIRQTLLQRVQLGAETARDHLNTLLLNVRTPDN